jgi:hypothetical protein
MLIVQDTNRAIKKRTTAKEKRTEKKRLKELQKALLGSVFLPLPASEKAVIDRNTLLNLVKQAYLRRSDPNLIH